MSSWSAEVSEEEDESSSVAARGIKEWFPDGGAWNLYEEFTRVFCENIGFDVESCRDEGGSAAISVRYFSCLVVFSTILMTNHFFLLIYLLIIVFVF